MNRKLLIFLTCLLMAAIVGGLIWFILFVALNFEDKHKVYKKVHSSTTVSVGKKLKKYAD